MQWEGEDRLFSEGAIISFSEISELKTKCYYKEVAKIILEQKAKYKLCILKDIISPLLLPSGKKNGNRYQKVRKLGKR